MAGSPVSAPQVGPFALVPGGAALPLPESALSDIWAGSPGQDGKTNDFDAALEEMAAALALIALRPQQALPATGEAEQASSPAGTGAVAQEMPASAPSVGQSEQAVQAGAPGMATVEAQGKGTNGGLVRPEVVIDASAGSQAQDEISRALLASLEDVSGSIWTDGPEEVAAPPTTSRTSSKPASEAEPQAPEAAAETAAPAASQTPAADPEPTPVAEPEAEQSAEPAQETPIVGRSVLEQAPAKPVGTSQAPRVRGAAPAAARATAAPAAARATAAPAATRATAAPAVTAPAVAGAPARETFLPASDSEAPGAFSAPSPAVPSRSVPAAAPAPRTTEETSAKSSEAAEANASVGGPIDAAGRSAASFALSDAKTTGSNGGAAVSEPSVPATPAMKAADSTESTGAEAPPEPGWSKIGTKAASPVPPASQATPERPATPRGEAAVAHAAAAANTEKTTPARPASASAALRETSGRATADSPAKVAANANVAEAGTLTNGGTAAPLAAASANVSSAASGGLQTDAASLRGVRVSELPSVLPQVARVVLPNGAREARIQLYPPELGSIRIQLSLQGDRVVAHITAERLQVRAMLEGMREELRSGMERAGLRLEHLEIRSSGPDAGSAGIRADQISVAPAAWAQGQAGDSGSGQGSWIPSQGAPGNAGFSHTGQPRGEGGRGQANAQEGMGGAPLDLGAGRTDGRGKARTGSAARGVDLWA